MSSIHTTKAVMVRCKRCGQSVPGGVRELPRDNIVVTCPLCGERRRYRPSEVNLDWPPHRLAAPRNPR